MGGFKVIVGFPKWLVVRVLLQLLVYIRSCFDKPIVISISLVHIVAESLLRLRMVLISFDQVLCWRTR